MTKHLVKYLFWAPVFIFIQIYILDHILFHGYINPYFYIMLLITLPQKTPNWFLFVFAFLLGFLVDVFEGGLGFHSTACLLVVFIKPFVEKLLIPKNTISVDQDLSLQKLGLRTFSVYALFLILTHHATLFLLAHFQLATIIQSFGKIILSSAITLCILLISQLLFYKPENR